MVYDATLSFFVDLSGHNFPPPIEINPPSEDDNAFPQSPQPQEEEDMSAWTIYIIVGLVVGAMLLVGLVAIVVVLCL